MWPGGPGEAQWYPCDPSCPGFSRAWPPAIKVGYRWHSSSLTYPFWRPTGLCTQLSSSGDFWKRELTFCFWTSIVTMTMNYKLAHAQDSAEKNDTGWILGFSENWPFLELFHGSRALLFKKKHTSSSPGRNRKEKRTVKASGGRNRWEHYSYEDSSISWESPSLLSSNQPLKEQKITTIERKRYFWECGHPPLNWKDDLKNILESLS